MNRQAVKCRVEGRVQGVFYRAETAEQAARLGIDGWVRNAPDGSVELVVVGEPPAIESLVAWLWQGPSGAAVSSVVVEEYQDPVEPGFSVRR